MQSFRKFPSILASIVLTTFSMNPLWAQGSSSSNNIFIIGILLIIGALILVSAILTLSENLIQIEAQKSGIDTRKTGLSIIPSLSSLWKKAFPAYTNHQWVYDTDKGYNILLNGGAALEPKKVNAKRYAMKPTDFRILAPIPKVVVSVGDEVKAGDILFFDKNNTLIKFVSPVSGEVVEVRRGQKRAITDVVVLADKQIQYKQFDPPSLKGAERQEIVDFLLKSGGWTLLTERPYDIIPDPESVPDNIFISTFDTAPLAPDNDFVIKGKEKLFQVGLDTLIKMTTGKVHLGLNANGEEAPNEAYVQAVGVEKHWFRGKHPIGNVGIQIHHIDPLKPGTKAWTLSVQEVICLGELMLKGIYNAERVIVLTGAQIKDPVYLRTFAGAQVGELLAEALKEGKNRIISGDVLSGLQLSENDFINFRSDQVTVIEEGDYFELFGWLMPIKPRPSLSRTFPNFLFPSLEFDGDTNTHGAKRAFVVTGEYEKVLPMHIYPQHLMKAILVGDFELMEGLGIHELTEEDIALCEFACTSKMPLQMILRDGLDMIREQS